MHGLDVRVERVRLANRLSSTLLSHRPNHRSKAHPNLWHRRQAPLGRSGFLESSGSEGGAVTPEVVAAWDGSEGVGFDSPVSRVVSRGGSP